MAGRPRSIYERFTGSTLPPPELREGSHVVEQGEGLISIANVEYGLREYDPDLWRGVAEKNGVENPFMTDTDYRGKAIRIAARKLPEFV